jgi:hypothetical protein
MKKDFTLRIPLSDIIDDWFARNFNVEVAWTKLTLVDHRDYEELDVYLSEGYKDIRDIIGTKDDLIADYILEDDE